MTQSDSAQSTKPNQPDGNADEQAGNAAADNADVDSLRAELENERARSQDNWERYLRASADLDNLRKRAARDVEHAHKYGLEKFAGEMLNVKDSMELGLSAASEDTDSKTLMQGSTMTLRLLEQILEKFGVEEVDPAGEPFDPQFHEAMVTQESSEVPANTVLQVIQKGYQLNGRLLRPARVIVSRA